MNGTATSVGSLFVVCGPPGVGKSTVARMVSETVDGVHLGTDEIRTELFDDPDYGPAESRTTYDTLFERASDHLVRGRDVVLDGTFSDRDKRDDARQAARSVGTTFDLLVIRADEAVVKERLATRTDHPTNPDFGVYLEKRTTFGDLADDAIVLDNSGTEAETRRRVEELLLDT